jgi:hypothetical protein
LCAKAIALQLKLSGTRAGRADRLLDNIADALRLVGRLIEGDGC